MASPHKQLLDVNTCWRTPCFRIASIKLRSAMPTLLVHRSLGSSEPCASLAAQCTTPSWERLRTPGPKLPDRVCRSGVCLDSGCSSGSGTMSTLMQRSPTQNRAFEKCRRKKPGAPRDHDSFHKDRALLLSLRARPSNTHCPQVCPVGLRLGEYDRS